MSALKAKKQPKVHVISPRSMIYRACFLTETRAFVDKWNPLSFPLEKLRNPKQMRKAGLFWSFKLARNRLIRQIQKEIDRLEILKTILQDKSELEYFARFSSNKGSTS